MGDIADMMLEGDLCAGCGGYIDGEGDGFPRYCSKDCEPNDFKVAHDPIGKDRSRVHCTICNKKVKVEGLHQHMTDNHGAPAVGKTKADLPRSLRDYFATTMSADEIGATVYHSLSRAAQESLIGRPHPLEPPVKASTEILAAYQLEKMQFAIDVSARIRFMHADAMLEARKS